MLAVLVLRFSFLFGYHAAAVPSAGRYLSLLGRWPCSGPVAFELETNEMPPRHRLNVGPACLVAGLQWRFKISFRTVLGVVLLFIYRPVRLTASLAHENILRTVLSLVLLHDGAWSACKLNRQQAALPQRIAKLLFQTTHFKLVPPRTPSGEVRRVPSPQNTMAGFGVASFIKCHQYRSASDVPQQTQPVLPGKRSKIRDIIFCNRHFLRNRQCYTNRASSSSKRPSA